METSFCKNALFSVNSLLNMKKTVFQKMSPFESLQIAGTWIPRFKKEKKEILKFNLRHAVLESILFYRKKTRKHNFATNALIIWNSSLELFLKNI